MGTSTIKAMTQDTSAGRAMSKQDRQCKLAAWLRLEPTSQLLERRARLANVWADGISPGCPGVAYVSEAGRFQGLHRDHDQSPWIRSASNVVLYIYREIGHKHLMVSKTPQAVA